MLLLHRCPRLRLAPRAGAAPVILTSHYNHNNNTACGGRLAQPTTRRAFHVLAPVIEAVNVTADTAQYIHHCGVPWWLTIPILAVGVNFGIRFPLLYYARRLRSRRAQLDPLIEAWAARHSRQRLPSQASSQQQDPSRQVTNARIHVSGLVEKSRRRIYREWGVQRYKSLAPLASFAPFLVISEAVRRLCGGPLSILGYSYGTAVAGEDDESSSSITAPLVVLDESMKDGGLWWFVDLTAMDPYAALPVLCTLALGGTSWFRMSKEQFRELLNFGSAMETKTRIQRIQIRLGRALLLVPLFPLLVPQMPSAIFLYWLSSFSLSYVNDALLDRLASTSPAEFKVNRTRKGLSPYLKGEDYRPRTSPDGTSERT